MDANKKKQAGKSGACNLLPLSRYEGTLAVRTYLSLKDAILSLAYEPGEILRKREICDVLGVSRSPVSEAIAKLSAEGLVDVVPKAGTFVSRFSMDEIREGAFLREALELAAVEQVANIITGEQVAMLRQNLKQQEEMIAAQDFAGFYDKDAELHDLIMSFTGFRRIGQMAQSSWVQVNRARHFNLPTPGRIQETIEEHKKIVDAIAARDPEKARKVTRDHLRQLIKYLEPLETKRPDLFEAPSTK